MGITPEPFCRNLEEGATNLERELKDILKELLPADRRELAKEIHLYLKKELREEDEENWSAAGELLDLYDCHTCVEHIAQVYSKGIMTAVQTDKGLVFEGDRIVSEEELEGIVDRTLHRERRFWVDNPKNEAPAILSCEEAMEQYRNLKEGHRPVKLIDVRTPGEYEENGLNGAVNIPLSKILLNPYRVAENVRIPVFLYCDRGYQSEIAAGCLSTAGFSKVTAFALNMD